MTFTPPPPLNTCWEVPTAPCPSYMATTTTVAIDSGYHTSPTLHIALFIPQNSITRTAAPSVSERAASKSIMPSSTSSRRMRHRSVHYCFYFLLSFLIFFPVLADPDAVSATIDMARLSPAPAVPPNFVGFSLGTGSVTGWVGSGNATTRASFLTLMRQLLLTPNQGGIVLRIGGDSADSTSMA